MFVEHIVIRLTPSISVIHFWIQFYLSTDCIRKMAILNWVIRNESSCILHLYLSSTSNKCYIFLDSEQPVDNANLNIVCKTYFSTIKSLYSFPAQTYANPSETFSMVMRKISWQPADKAPIARLPF